ncbi:MAG TPA: hypothetical protein VFM80_01455 [Gracilimonas sp.]|uniref:hypothetical protein n=1 Tax=Gracilimonas sp. TaxID=1974203 RepID=UPI002D9FDF81|nr:hypothetical protein [Gracilimonas sp.]
MRKLTYSSHLIALILISGLSMVFAQIEVNAQDNNAEKWLNKMADAVIEPGTEVETLTTDIEQTVISPMGDITLSGTSTVNFETGNQSAVLETPQGKVEVIIEDGEGVQKVGGREIPMNGVQLQQVETEMERNYVNVARNKDSLDAEFLGMETIDDTEYAKVKINFTVPVTYYLDTETALPDMITFNQFNQQTGSEVEVQVKHSDWRTVSGVTYAFSIESFAGGQKAGSGTVKSLTVNE